MPNRSDRCRWTWNEVPLDNLMLDVDMFSLFIKHVASKCNLSKALMCVYAYVHIYRHVCTCVAVYLFILFNACKWLFSCHKAGHTINESSSIPTWKRNKMMMKCDKIRWAATEVRKKSRSRNVEKHLNWNRNERKWNEAQRVVLCLIVAVVVVVVVIVVGIVINTKQHFYF